jgi:hypothetical protein
MIVKCARCKKKLDILDWDYGQAFDFACQFRTIARFECLECAAKHETAMISFLRYDREPRFRKRK